MAGTIISGFTIGARRAETKLAIPSHPPTQAMRLERQNAHPESVLAGCLLPGESKAAEVSESAG
jgi:hypothetical protein